MNEWPLVTFTLFVQSSVGVTLFSALYFCWLEKEIGNQRATVAMRPVLLTAAILGCLGLLASTLHMGYPWNAFHALRHISSSWLSREIIFAAVYLGALCLYTLVVLIKGHMNKTLLAVIGLLGIIDIICMASLYYNTSMLTWMHINTYFMFIGALFSTGAAIALLITAFRVKAFINSELTKRIVISALVVIFLAVTLRMAEQPFYLEWMSSVISTNDAITFPHTPIIAYNETFGLRISAWILSILGMLMMGYSVWKYRNAVFTSGLRMVLASSATILVAEILNRFAFFIVK
ncbi:MULTISPECIES: dimethyl sulfoxide reductase anchor subunit family protein [Proteus]|uniref:dimethyl sulfoxide reductase anchor subunit family protein n=1 Tax=Proteus TaxID=583 RepID=UPI000E00DF36|nr:MULTISPECIES: DmsC/YnfH family molybdoenzyme membrane anchor subunit [Proteus]NBM13082.1 dimethyl sulfoxide reductase anchor subunit [Proteus sp. G2670]NBM33289.1 dimethyl sulfoxide reductase anchor subunit [Proteus sp. G2664]NBM88287.1 dimethyl sulfoxide reductase anchor subunit [Proteus sp. G2661]NBM94893.1 dimethyl sulfoxide reductase anchor subunit [Proteus sp. G2662]NBN25177.1 dimethyl sulfoxide reductase anchor subunit [Proteus sp. G2657]